MVHLHKSLTFDRVYYDIIEKEAYLVLECKDIYILGNVSREEFKEFVNNEDPDKFFEEKLSDKKPEYAEIDENKELYENLIHYYED